MAKNSDNPTVSKWERFLAFGFILCVFLTVVSIILILLAAFVDLGFQPVGLGLVPMLALPIGFVLLVSLLVIKAKGPVRQKFMD